MENLISVIVPIYNAEQYLNDCLASVTGQSYKNLQIILINDGSTDNSLKIAKQFADADPRIALVDQKNAGVAAARQAGLNRATGSYIIHYDSDDIVPQDAIKSLINTAKAADADMVVGNYIRRKKDKDKYNSHQPVTNVVFLRKMLMGEYPIALWNKLIKRDLYTDFHFTKDLNYGEDKLAVTSFLIKKEVKVVFLESFVYIYRYAEESYTSIMSEKSVISAHIVDNMIFSMINDLFDERFIAHLKNKRRISSLLNSNLSQQHHYPEANKYIWQDERLKRREKLLLLLDIKGFHKIVMLYKSLSKAGSRKK